MFDLLIHGENQRPWSVQELALELGDALGAADAVASLRAAGLVQTTSHGFIFAARVAVQHSQLIP